MNKGLRCAGVAVLASGLAVSAAWAQTSPTVKDDLFSGTEKFAAGASEVTEVNMDPDTLSMVGGHDAQRAHGMVLNVVKTYEYPKAGMYNIADVEAIRARLNTGDWHCTVHTRELKSGESTDICYKHRTDGMVEQAIITAEPRELTFIHQIRRGGGGDGSHLDLPEMGMVAGPEMAALGPEMEARMAAMRPEMEAKMAAIGPEIEAKMAAMQPKLEAQMAAIGPQIEAQMAALQPEIEASIERAQEAAQGEHLWDLQKHTPQLSPEQLKELQRLQEQDQKARH